MRSLSLLKALLSSLLLALGAAGAFGEIKESKDWIVDTRAHKFLTSLAEKVGTEDTVLDPGHAVATLSINGCNLSVLVVGPVAGDARAYARAIDGWRARAGFDGDVLWSQEDDGAAASYRYRPGRIGQTRASTTIDLPGLREALMRVEPRTQFAVGDAAWSKTDLGFPPDATTSSGTRYWNLTSSGTRYWNLTSPPPAGLRPVVGSIVLPGWMPGLLLAWFLIPIVGVLGSFAVGVAIAKSARIPLERRRKLYGKAVTGGSFGTLGLHGVLVLATLPTRLFDPLAQLWFGQRFSQFALPLVMLFAFVPMLALPFVNRVEKRLMGPSEEEKLQQEPLRPLRPIATPPKSWLSRYSWVFLVAGLALVGLSSQLPKTAEIRTSLGPIGFLLIALPNLFSLRTKDTPKFVVESETLDALGARLRARVAAMADRLGMAAPPSRVLVDAIYGRFGAILDGKGVGVTVGALEELAPEEVDFLVAHELAHGKLGHRAKRMALTFGPMAVVLIPMMFLALGGRTAFSTPAFVFTPMLISIVAMIPYRFFLQKRLQAHEFAADRLAVEATGDPEAACRTLRKITLNDASPGLHDVEMSSHPAVGARIRALGGTA